jgi:hypothetical protein
MSALRCRKCQANFCKGVRAEILTETLSYFAFITSALAGCGFSRRAVEDMGERGPCRNVNAGGAAAARRAPSVSSRR